jgi:recombination protein RecT
MSTAVAKKSTDTFAKIEERILGLQETGVQFPQNYSPINAAQSARMILQETKDKSGKSALEVCTPPSIANAVLKMVTLGLNPIKKQCYFLVYGNKLECQTSYQGNIAIAKRFGLKDVKAVLIYEGDNFEYNIEQDGRIKISKHSQSFGSLNKKIIGAYAVTTMEDETIDTTIMTMEDIQNAWKQGATNGNSPAHKNFSGEMAKKSVINRACKSIINSSDDAALLEDEPRESVTEAHVKHQIKENANKQEFGFDEEEEEYEVAEEVKEDPEAENQRLYEEAMAGENGQVKMDPGF